MKSNQQNTQKTVILASFGKEVSLAGAVPRTLSGSAAGRVLGWACHCTTSLVQAVSSKKSETA